MHRLSGFLTPTTNAVNARKAEMERFKSEFLGLKTRSLMRELWWCGREWAFGDTLLMGIGLSQHVLDGNRPLMMCLW